MVIWGRHGLCGVQRKNNSTVILKRTCCINYCFLITVFAYDHTIKANPARGKSIKYFKTGLGVGKNLKRLETLIAENNHTNTVIEYLKVLNNLSVIYVKENSLVKDRHRVGWISDWRIQRLVLLWCSSKRNTTRYYFTSLSFKQTENENYFFSDRASSSQKHCEWVGTCWKSGKLMINDSEGISTCWRYFKRCTN